jgi:peptidoglycan-N-acetylglucosamine deacetylase
MEGVLRLASRLLPRQVLCAVRTCEPVYALTFDDGPSPVTTSALLKVLAERGAQATFFLIGERATQHRELVEQILTAGNEIGNHMMRDSPSILLSRAEFARQLDEAEAVLGKYTRLRWFRPGSGWFRRSMLEAAAARGLRCVLGTMVAVNSPRKSAEAVAGRFVQRIRPGSIAVLHEGADDRAGVVDTAQLVLDGMSNLGLRSVTLSDLVGCECH